MRWVESCSILGTAKVRMAAAVVISPGLFPNGVTPSLEITYRKNIAADDLIFEAQTAPDLQSWSEMPVELVSTIANGDGTELVTYRSTTPFGSVAKEFIRLLVRTRP
ncbi:hypothetical protein OAG88_00340 [Akkermansiaceae bacterium]|nr:hypothetical protein [Akkermansiaceae bacterium]